MRKLNLENTLFRFLKVLISLKVRLHTRAKKPSFIGKYVFRGLAIEEGR